MRAFTAVILVLGFAVPIHAAEDEKGWTFSGHLGGTSSSSGLILKADPSLGYSFNRYVSAYAGLPLYFVNPASALQTSNGFVNGIGNAYGGSRLRLDSSALDVSSNLVVSAPTGDRSRGFSTGRVTVDWTNDFARSFSLFRPFASVGVANTISDTSFFARPFSSLGLVSHFEGGSTFYVLPRAHVGGSAYALRASGEQRIASRTFESRGARPGNQAA